MESKQIKHIICIAILILLLLFGLGKYFYNNEKKIQPKVVAKNIKKIVKSNKSDQKIVKTIKNIKKIPKIKNKNLVQENTNIKKENVKSENIKSEEPTSAVDVANDFLVKENANIIFNQSEYNKNTHRLIGQELDFDKQRKGVLLVSLDPILSYPKLDIIGIRDGNFDNLSFFIYSNYLKFIDNAKICVYSDKQGRELIQELNIKNLKINMRYDIKLNRHYNEKDNLYYQIKVFDKDNKHDETKIKRIEKRKKDARDEDIAKEIYDKTTLKIHNIPANYFKVRFYGKRFGFEDKIMFDGNEIPVDGDGTFVYESMYFPGEYNFEFKVYKKGKEIEVDDENDKQKKEEITKDFNNDLKILENESEQLNNKKNKTIKMPDKYLYSVYTPIKIDKNYHFIVGIADVKIGKTIGNSNELALKNPELDEGMFQEGRLAFYTRNRIDKYSIVAQLDTENQELKHIFDGLGKRDNRQIFKDLRTEDKGYTFGDDSSSMMDVDTQGQFYLRLEWDKNKILWGNYNADINDGEYLNYSKSLYGIQAKGASQKVTSDENSVYSGSIFYSNPETQSEYNIFLATGGSLYYLNERDIVDGSETVTIQVINQNTGQIVKEESLSESEDYTINNIQGRIILNEPLFQYSYKDLGSIIKDRPISDYKTYLKVSYEYYSVEALYSDSFTGGVNGDWWINDNIKIGTAYVKSNELEEVYELKGLHGVFKKSKNTYLNWEFAQSRGGKIGTGAYSSTGGMDFQKINHLDISEIDDGDKLQNKGTAFGLKAVMSLNEIYKGFSKGSLAEIWYKRKERGFSIDSLEDGSDDTELGLKSDYIVTDKFNVSVEYSEKKTEDEDSKDNERSLTVQGNYVVSKKMTVAVALKTSDNSGDNDEDNSNSDSFQDDYNYNEDNDDEIGKSVDAAVDVSYQFTNDTQGSLGIQKTLSTTKMDMNDITGNLSLTTKIMENLKLNGTYSAGNKESASTLQMAYALSDNYETYVNLENQHDYDGDTNNVSFGQKAKIADGYEVFQENQVNLDSEQKEITQTYGVNIDVTKEIRLTVGYEQGDLKDGEKKERRNSVSTGLYYDDRKKVKYNNRLEMIRDKGDGDYTIEWLTANDARYKLNDEWTVVGKLDYSITQDKANGGYDKKFMELGVGGAYRPIWNDRLNLLWRYTYIYDLEGDDDEDDDYSFGDFDERANIWSFDGIYDLTKKLEIGWKLAYKKAEMKAAKGESKWYNAVTKLYGISASYNFYKNWRISGEYNWLISDSDNEKKQGVIAGIDYDVTKNLRVGVGYNFTDFSDDLRYENYNSHGIYLNIVGKL